jgi:DNA-nicking Smr family endonuclease
VDERDESEEVDLHGLHVDQALRRVAQALHAARVRRRRVLLVITGAGWGNADGKPVLRPKVEAWLRGPEGLYFVMHRMLLLPKTIEKCLSYLFPAM